MPENKNNKEDLRKYLFSERDLIAIQALSGSRFFRENTDMLTAETDVDTENPIYLLLQGIIGFRRGWRLFPDKIVPRLKGIHRYNQVRNSAEAGWFQSRLSLLEENGIPVMLTGGSAVRAHFAADTPRIMFGYDITVPSEKYESALRFLPEIVKDADKNRTVEKNTTEISFLKLYKGVPHAGLFSEKELWDEARRTKYYNKAVFIPSDEAALLQLFCLPYGPRIVLESAPERDRRMAECCRILQRDIDFCYLSELAGRAGVKDAVRFYLDFLSELMPDIISGADWEAFFADDKSYRAYISAVHNLFRTSEDIKKQTEKKEASLTDKALLRLAGQRVLRHIKRARL